jgi:hypothetical protein
MTTLPQPSLFSWQEIDASPEILRLRRVLDTLPDQPIIDELIEQRAGKRNDYPIEAVWNSLIAGIVFGHDCVESLRRELLRNAELRQICGFDPLRRDDAVPGAPTYSRFLKKLYKLKQMVDAMFHQLVEDLKELLPDFGKDLAIDGKAIQTHGSNDPDADWGGKTYLTADANGKTSKHTKWWFGYKLHLVVDANYELPVGFEVTKASVHETTRLTPMVEDLEEKHPELLARTENLSADRGYDNASDKARLYDRYSIMPLIDTRNMHMERVEGEAPQPKWMPLDPYHNDAIYYDGTGRVACKVAPFEADDGKAYAWMEFKGFEKDRGTLKFRCPAAAHGITCHNRDSCRCKLATRDGEHGRVVRIPLKQDRRIFMPTHRHSNTFRSNYKKRSAVERVNSRVDQVYGFERHFIRGLEKMKLRVGLAMVVMLATAVAWIRAGEKEKARSLLRAA